MILVRSREDNGMKRVKSSKVRQLRKNQGQGLVEFAIVVPLFFLLVFAVLDLGRYYFVKITIENAVRQAGRFAVTGQSLSNMTRVASIKQVAQNSAPGLDLTQIIVSSTLGGSNQAGDEHQQ